MDVSYMVLFVLDVFGSRYLTGEAQDMILKVLVVVNLGNDISKTSSRAVAITEWADQETVSKKELLVKGS
jgi:hypothetical protein